MQTGKKPTERGGTDWERVKREAAQDAPVPFEAGSEPYDPNDPAAVAAYWAKATMCWTPLRLRGRAGKRASMRCSKAG